MEEPEINEQKLLLKLKEGSPDSFKLLVEFYQQRIINTCFGFVKDREDAEEVAQEVFLKVYRSLATFRKEARLSTWIYRIAISKSLDWLRKKKRKKRFDPRTGYHSGEDEIERLAAPANLKPEEILAGRERIQLLHRAIDTLPRSQKIAITLAKLEGIGIQEIARILGTSQSAVDSLLQRAKKNLKTRLTRYYEKNGKK